jgi:hypothetical protein
MTCRLEKSYRYFEEYYRLHIHSQAEQSALLCVPEEWTLQQ